MKHKCPANPASSADHDAKGYMHDKLPAVLARPAASSSNYTKAIIAILGILIPVIVSIYMHVGKDSLQPTRPGHRRQLH